MRKSPQLTRVGFDGVIDARSKLVVAQDADARVQRGSLEAKRDVFVATRGALACLAFLGGLDGSYIIEYQLGDEELRRSVGDSFVAPVGLHGRASGQPRGGGQGEREIARPANLLNFESG